MRLRIKSAEFRIARGIRRVVDMTRFVLIDLIGKRTTLKMFALLLTYLVLMYAFDMNFWFSAIIVFCVYLALGGWKFIRIIFLTFRRDLKGLYMLINITLSVKSNIRNKKTTPKIFDETAKKYPRKPFFLFQDKTWTFSDMQSYSNRVANYLTAAGFQKGDVVAIFSENRPEVVGLWLGMSKIGVVAALINFNLRDVSLAHCIHVSNVKAVIFAPNLETAVQDVSSALGSLAYFSLGSTTGTSLSVTNLELELENTPSHQPPPITSTCSDRLFLVYTSGTTGLPKAAVISHTRFFYMAMGVRLAFSMSSDDVLYIPLPLYHTAGGIVGVGQAIVGGTSLALRAKFSASQFWTDCVKYRCTAAQYIGEICRYLLAQPMRAEEKEHSVRVMFGNGIKPQIWTQFQKRFQVPLIGEFYGATEGNCNIVNFENKVGAVGFTTRIAPFLYPITLIKVNPETNEILRDKYGVCIKAQPGEPGELVGKIVKGNPVREFDGYVDERATSKKLYTDVFVKGDRAFSTGDILVMDELGYMYFMDRTGDTFRWRGENVSTNEVEAVISAAVELNDAVVYGVEVPGAEGRAGMAAIVDPNENIDIDKLGHALTVSLPPYARPVFLRFMREADTTGTFKLKKVKLRDEGFSIKAISDPLYFLNPRSHRYEPLTPELYADILNGVVRL